jgi:Domain of unknown function (DUF222)/HNH endonuclease
MGMTFEELEAVEVSGSDSAAVRRMMREAATFRGRVEVVMARLAVRAEELFERGEGPDAGRVIAKETKVSPFDAERTRRRGTAINEQPGLSDSLASGELSAEHVDVLAAAIVPLTEGERLLFQARAEWLRRQAVGMPPGEFRRLVQNVCDQIRDMALDRAGRQREASRASMWWNETSGMLNVRLELHPELGSSFENAVNARAAAMKNLSEYSEMDHAQRVAIAIADLALATSRAERPGLVEVMVIVDAATVDGGRHDHSVCELCCGATVPVESARRLLCTASRITWVSVDEDGTPLRVGFTERHANRQQRRLLRAMYRTCAIEGCGMLFDRCEIHHVVWIENGGPTDIDNLVPICSRHHHLVHEGGWRLLIDKARTITLIRPDGQIDTRTPFTGAYPQPRRQRTADREPDLVRTG